MIAAALLHDTVEDHAAELASEGTTVAALGALTARFGPRVAELVALVTNPEYEPDRDKNEQYREQRDSQPGRLTVGPDH